MENIKKVYIYIQNTYVTNMFKNYNIGAYINLNGFMQASMS